MSYSPKNPNGQETMANSEPVVIASDQSAVPVSAASLPLPTGAATSAAQGTLETDVEAINTRLGEVQESPTANTVLDRLKALLTELQLKADLTETQPVSVAAGDNNMGNVDIVTVPADPFGANADAIVAAGAAGSIQAKLRRATQGLEDLKSLIVLAAGDNNIGNVDIASIAAGDNNIGNVDIASALPAGSNAIGKLLPPDIDVTTHSNYAKKYYTNAGAVTDGIIWSPAAGKRWHIVALFVNVSAAATVTFEDDKAGGDEAVLKMELAANSGTVIPFPEKYPLASGEDAADLIVTTTAGNVYITCVGYEI